MQWDVFEEVGGPCFSLVDVDYPGNAKEEPFVRERGEPQVYGVEGAREGVYAHVDARVEQFFGAYLEHFAVALDGVDGDGETFGTGQVEHGCEYGYLVVHCSAGAGEGGLGPGLGPGAIIGQ